MHKNWTGQKFGHKWKISILEEIPIPKWTYSWVGQMGKVSRSLLRIWRVFIKLPNFWPVRFFMHNTLVNSKCIQFPLELFRRPIKKWICFSSTSSTNFAKYVCVQVFLHKEYQMQILTFYEFRSLEMPNEIWLGCEAFNIRKFMGASHLTSLQPRSLSMGNCDFYLEAEANIFLFVKGFL